MAPIRRFEDIKAWQAARELNQAFLKALSDSPTFRNQSLKDQMTRCTDSAMSNIVEGFDSGSDAEFIRFLNIAYRSMSEFQSHLYTAVDGGHMTDDKRDVLYCLAQRTKGLIGGFRRYLEKSLASKPRRRRRRRKSR